MVLSIFDSIIDFDMEYTSYELDECQPSARWFS